MIKEIFYREMFEDPNADYTLEFPFMADNFNGGDTSEAVLHYIMEGGEIDFLSTINSTDVFTGADTGIRAVMRTDGVFEWSADLAYYVREYGLSLPDEFVEHINKTA